MKVHFEEIFTDCTKLATKIPQANYLPSGRYPIVDQGQSQIAGYTNTSEGLFTDVPAIIFGDHTRIVKYIDTPFFIGADGVKVLKSILQNANYKYLFYALNNVKIPNTGYNRHFKWLKESSINLSDRKEQKRIAGRLDKVQELIALQKEQLKKLDDLIKSRFIGLFGNPITNPKGWPLKRMGDLFKITSGGTPSRKHSEYFENGDIPWVKTGDLNTPYLTFTDEYITELGVQKSTAKIFPKGTVLLAMYGATIGAVSILDIEAATNQACAAFLPIDSILPIYLYSFLFLQKKRFVSLGVGGAQPNISGEILKREKILCPPLKLQTEFADFVTKIEAQKGLLATRLSHLETLYKSLMQEYFG